MCTLTWLRLADGYELFFNRDEKLTRATALPPRIDGRAGTRWIAPLDPDGGGTWLGVNEHGVAIGLLNGYASADQAARAFESRGGLVTALLDVPSLDALRRRLDELDLARYRSFSIVAFESGAGPLCATWSGEALETRALDEDAQPVCSSSLDPLGAGRSRRGLYAARFASAPPDRAALEHFHASHEPERGSLSPCMHRADAQTVSYSHIVVTRERASFEYSHAAPCQRAPSIVLDIARVLRGARAS